MIFNRNKLFTSFPWLKKKNLPMIVSADYDGLICASFLHHHLNWNLEGYYDLSSIWVSKKGIKSKISDIITVDVKSFSKVTSPSYDLGLKKDDLVEKWKQYYN